MNCMCTKHALGRSSPSLPPCHFRTSVPVPSSIKRRGSGKQKHGSRHGVCAHPLVLGRPAVRTAALGQKPGLLSTLVTEHLSEAAGFDPAAQFLIAHGVGSLLVPLLYGWAITAIMHYVAQQARAWCAQNPDRPVTTEVIGMLPSALEGPTVTTVYTMVAVRLVRNAAWVLDAYVHTFNPQWNKSVDALVETICGYLVPIDAALVKVYSLIVVAFVTVVLVRWKTIALEYVLLKKQSDEAAAAAIPGAGTSKAVGTTEDFERMLVPLDAVSSWLAYVAGALACAQVLGLNIAPLLAVGGASSIIVGLATQQLLTNAIMGLSLFLTRPFVAGDSVTCQGAGGILLSGVVERVTPMRTTLRTDDDVIVSVPNKTVADMVVYNRSATVASSRLAKANRKTEPLKLRIKVPHAATSRLGDLQAAVVDVLSAGVAGLPTPIASSSGDSDSVQLTSSSSSSSHGDVAGGATGGGRGSSSSSFLSGDFGAGGEAALVQLGSIRLQLSKFTDVGLELLVKAHLRADPSSPAVQAMLLELSSRVRQAGAVLVNL